MLMNTDAFVLKSRKYNEADSLLVLFSRKLGRISAVAKGSRRAKSQMLAGIQPFSYSHFLLYQGRSMYTVNQVDTLKTFYPLREDYRRLTYASYIVELIEIEISEEQSHPKLFNLFGKALSLLSDETTEIETLIRSFELQFMTVCGYEPNLFHCTHCQKSKDKKWYFSLSQGGLICNECRSKEKDTLLISGTCLKLARYLQTKDITDSQHLKIHPRLNEELQQINKAYLLYHMGRYQFKSLKLLPQVDDLLPMPSAKSRQPETGSAAHGLTEEAKFDTFNEDEDKAFGNEQEE